jgi:hypothetical protein
MHCKLQPLFFTIALAESILEPFISISYRIECNHCANRPSVFLEWDGLYLSSVLGDCSVDGCFLLLKSGNELDSRVLVSNGSEVLETVEISCSSVNPDCAERGDCCGGEIQLSPNSICIRELNACELALSPTPHIKDSAIISNTIDIRIPPSHLNSSQEASPGLARHSGHAPPVQSDAPDGAHAPPSAPPSDSSSEPLYSRHTCVGWDPQRDAVSDATCLFENVCLLDGAFHYFMHPGIRDARLPLLHAVGRRHALEPGETFRPAVRRGPVPAAAAAALDPRPHAYIHRCHPRNYGHVLGDDAWPIAQGMLLFLGRVDDELQARASRRKRGDGWLRRRQQ